MYDEHNTVNNPKRTTYSSIILHIVCHHCFFSITNASVVVSNMFSCSPRSLEKKQNNLTCAYFFRFEWGVGEKPTTFRNHYRNHWPTGSVPTNGPLGTSRDPAGQVSTSWCPKIGMKHWKFVPRHGTTFDAVGLLENVLNGRNPNVFWPFWAKMVKS